MQRYQQSILFTPWENFITCHTFMLNYHSQADLNVKLFFRLRFLYSLESAIVIFIHTFKYLYIVGIATVLYTPLRWRHNDHAGVSNHQPHGCLLNRLFRRKSKKTSKLRVTGLCVGNSPGTGEFPEQMASYAENVSIWWRHHADNISNNSLLVNDTYKRPKNDFELVKKITLNPFGGKS